ncbi:MAG: EamA family transporter [Brevundimonas sp.]|nr:EamA family transporter [Brevundimonas sp.]
MTFAAFSPRIHASWKPFVPYLALAGAMLSIAFGTSFAKQLFPVVGAAGTSGLRVGIAALILLAVFRPWRLKLTRGDVGRVLAFGAALGLMNLVFYMSLRTIPLGLALAIEFTGPLCLALIHARRLIHFVWIGLAAIGLLLLLPLHQGAGALDPAGVGFALIAAVCWALYIIFGKRLAHIPSGPSVAMGMTVAAFVVLPFGIAQAGSTLILPSVLALGLVVAIASSAIPYSLDMIAMRGMPKRTFGVLLSGEPAIGALAGLLFLHEHLSGLQWLAIAAIVMASAGAMLTTRRDEPEPAPQPA